MQRGCCSRSARNAADLNPIHFIYLSGSSYHDDGCFIVDIDFIDDKLRKDLTEEKKLRK